MTAASLVDRERYTYVDAIQLSPTTIALPAFNATPSLAVSYLESVHLPIVACHFFHISRPHPSKNLNTMATYFGAWTTAAFFALSPSAMPSVRFNHPTLRQSAYDLCLCWSLLIFLCALRKLAAHLIAIGGSGSWLAFALEICIFFLQTPYILVVIAFAYHVQHGHLLRSALARNVRRYVRYSVLR